jgi:hypothetical protein
MLSLPRQMRLENNTQGGGSRLTFAPADELRKARVASTHAVVQPTAVGGGNGSAAIAVGSVRGNTREVQLSLLRWIKRTPGGSCGFQLRGGAETKTQAQLRDAASGGGGGNDNGVAADATEPEGCVLEVMFTAAGPASSSSSPSSSLVVRSWCGSSSSNSSSGGGGPRGKVQCLPGSDDAFNHSALAGYCYNVSLPPSAPARAASSNVNIAEQQLTAVIDKSVRKFNLNGSFFSSVVRMN